jgi:hypothetical protein
VAVAVLLTNRDPVVTCLLLFSSLLFSSLLFVAIAGAAAVLALRVHPPRWVALLRKHIDSTTSTG